MSVMTKGNIRGNFITTWSANYYYNGLYRVHIAQK